MEHEAAGRIMENIEPHGYMMRYASERQRSAGHTREGWGQG